MFYSSNLDNKWRYLIIGLVGIVSFLINYFLKGNIFYSLLTFGVLFSLLLFLLDKFFFKIPLLKNTIPNFNGTWEGKGDGTFNKNGESKTTFNVKINIKQTFITISINGDFSKSKSESISCFIERKNNKDKLYYTYFNEPKATEKELDKHYGTIILQKTSKTQIEGNYFTDRKPQTKGSIVLTKTNSNNK